MVGFLMHIPRTLSVGLFHHAGTLDSLHASWDVRGEQDTTARFNDFPQIAPYSPGFLVNSYLVTDQLIRAEMVSGIFHAIARDRHKINCRWFESPNTLLSLAE